MIDALKLAEDSKRRDGVRQKCRQKSEFKFIIFFVCLYTNNNYIYH